MCVEQGFVQMRRCSGATAVASRARCLLAHTTPRQSMRNQLTPPHLVCEEDVLDSAHLRQPLGQHWVEAGGVNHHVALWTHNDEGLTSDGHVAAPVKVVWCRS